MQIHITYICTVNTYIHTGSVSRIHCISANGYNSLNECPVYDTKQSDGEASVMLELSGSRSKPLLPSLLGPIWPGVVAPDWVLFMGQIELFDI